MKVRQARNAKIVRNIKSPLTEQTKCIIALIKYSFTNLELMEKLAQTQEFMTSKQYQLQSESPKGSGSE